VCVCVCVCVCACVCVCVCVCGWVCIHTCKVSAAGISTLHGNVEQQRSIATAAARPAHLVAASSGVSTRLLRY
jgi:hypothetical protein